MSYVAFREPYSFAVAELHFHTTDSPDAGEGCQTRLEAYTEAQTNGMKVVASTDHSGDSGGGVDWYTDVMWTATLADVNGAYSENVFVPLPGYEWTTQPGAGESDTQGHRNVIYRYANRPMYHFTDYGTLAALWAALAVGNDGGKEHVITIPHHTGARRTADNYQYAVSWGNHDATYQRLMEVYNSWWGQSVLYDPTDELAYEALNPPGSTNPMTSVNGAHYWRDALEAGLKLGAVAGTDSHYGRPALRAHTLIWCADPYTNETIFEGLWNRRTAAIAGTKRIRMAYSCNEKWMGQTVSCAVGSALQFNLAALTGYSTLQWIEISRWRGGAWSQAYYTEPAAESASVQFADTATASAIYYATARLTDLDPELGTACKIWGSPIWVEVS